MKPRADYDRIAQRYDHDRRRYASSADPEVLSWAGTVLGRVVLLDVGCGTGAWLAAQTVPPSVLRVGLDASEGMLRAAPADEGIRFVRGVSERLPFASSSVGWLESRFAVAHFEERLFLAEAARVLRVDGVLRIVSVLPPFDRAFAIYDVFPAARVIDEKRFPRPEAVVEWMQNAGFESVESVALPYRTEWSAADFLEMLEGRTASQLDLLDDAEFAGGLERARRMTAGDPARTFVDEGFIWVFRGLGPGDGP